jgi:hypothetical protein
MSSLFVYILPGEKFDKQTLKALWSRTEGVCNVREPGTVGAALSARFDYRNGSTILNLTNDLEAIALSGLGEASLEMAFRLQQHHRVALQIFDDGYSFNLVIRNYRSVGELGQAIYTALGAELPPALSEGTN